MNAPSIPQCTQGPTMTPLPNKSAESAYAGRLVRDLPPVVPQGMTGERKARYLQLVGR